MNLLNWLGLWINRLLQSQANTGRYFYGDFHYIAAGGRALDRWAGVNAIADLRPTDVVLDMGCAEGLISLEIARQVARVDGIDILERRVERARLEASRRKIGNVNFRVGSAIDCILDRQSYDVVFLLNVLSRKAGVGLDELEKLLAATRRQIIIRTNVQKIDSTNSYTLIEIMDAMKRCGFDGICFLQAPNAHGNLIIGNRRGTDARLRSLPPIALVPSEYLLTGNALGFRRGTRSRAGAGPKPVVGNV